MGQHAAADAPLRDVLTQRLSLRRLRSNDLDALVAVFAQREVWEFEYGRGLTPDETEAFLRRQLQLWADYGFGGCAVRELSPPDLVGVIGLAVPTVLQELVPPVTIGWRFSPTVWGRGYATEAASAVLDQAFTTMGLDRVGCVTSAENRRSVGVAERLGMTFVTEASAPSDDGTSTVTAALFEIERDRWLVGQNDRS